MSFSLRIKIRQWNTCLLLKYKLTFITISLFFSFHIFKIMVVLKVETDNITSISASQIGQVMTLSIRHVKTFKTDIIVFTSKIIMCLMSHYSHNDRLFSVSESISWYWQYYTVGQRENVQIIDKQIYLQMQDLINVIFVCNILTH